MVYSPSISPGFTVCFPHLIPLHAIKFQTRRNRKALRIGIEEAWTSHSSKMIPSNQGLKACNFLERSAPYVSNHATTMTFQEGSAANSVVPDPHQAIIFTTAPDDCRPRQEQIHLPAFCISTEYCSRSTRPINHCCPFGNKTIYENKFCVDGSWNRRCGN